MTDRRQYLLRNDTSPMRLALMFVDLPPTVPRYPDPKKPEYPPRLAGKKMDSG